MPGHGVTWPPVAALAVSLAGNVLQAQVGRQGCGPCPGGDPAGRYEAAVALPGCPSVHDVAEAVQGVWAAQLTCPAESCPEKECHSAGFTVLVGGVLGTVFSGLGALLVWRRSGRASRRTADLVDHTRAEPAQDEVLQEVALPARRVPRGGPLSHLAVGADYWS